MKMVMKKKIRIKMKDKSSISPIESIALSGCWILIIFVAYKNTVFISLNNCTVSISKIILLAHMAATSVIGSILRWKRCMRFKYVLVDIMAGAGIYSGFSYKHYYYGWIIGVCLSFILISFFIFYYLLFHKKYKGERILQIKNMQLKSLLVKRRIFMALNNSFLLLGLIMSIMLAPVLYNQQIHGGVIYGEKNRVNSGDDIVSRDYYSVGYNFDTISLIRFEETWRPLSTREKLKVLQDICYCEMAYFGISDITIGMEDLDKHVLGSFNNNERIILIDKQHLENDSPESVLETTLHELFHAWEFSLLNLYIDSNETQRKMRIFEHCDEYLSEIGNYSKGADRHSYLKYYCQYMEEDARDYASLTVKEYYYEINNILEEKTDSSIELVANK